MATPSSSATSPSPPTSSYLQHGASSQQVSTSSTNVQMDQENKDNSVDKFLARAEVAMVTRALRTRLSYASYKATHNIPQVPLRDLEAQTQNHMHSFNRVLVAKRKAHGTPNHYHNHIHNAATQGPNNNNAGSGSMRRGGPGSMAPPASVSSPRTMPSTAPGTPGYANNDNASQRLSSQAPSLYTSILAPPPTKQARTIHNPNDPHVPPPTRPEPSPRTRAPKPSPQTTSSRSHAKKPSITKSAKVAASPNRRRTQPGSIDKGKQKQKADDMDVDGDGDVDMKAAAALTSLLRHHNRPSIGSASSPRSSIDGSEVGSAYSFPHFAQSSTRTSAPNVQSNLSTVASSSNLAVESSTSTARAQTPPPGGGLNAQHTSPRAAPTDSEAANLMLFLATSPSPARPANKESKDMATYRALGGGAGLRSKGRVLFPSSSAADSTNEDNVTASSGPTRRAAPLVRGGDSSFTSTVSSIGGELGGGNRASSSDAQNLHNRATHTGAGSSSGDNVPQLLPPVPLQLPSGPGSPAGRKETASRNKPFGVSGGSGNGGSLEFNINEFINASPSSPGRSVHQTHHSQGSGGNHKSNLGLRADVGRKLFEEEQMRHAHALQAASAASGIAVPSQRQEERTLGAGIDLIHS
ncbi:hypothetical protein D9613_007517 [Agrocybe pediades]|uniref:Uncharacterized protein n=1 Tax=Agrocybe pediades TaxID=84607 RepID=A0A8H4VK85_9AGAR|nr:hypothetical protein D9613_007517 [Agrocybe pediades]